MNRLKAITDALESRDIDGVLISDLRNVRYLSGFSGSSGSLLITRERSFFLTDFRYEAQARKEVRGFGLVIEKEERAKVVVRQAKAAGIKSLGFESTVSYGFYRSLIGKGLRLKAVNNLVEDMRKVKNRGELKMIEEAVRRAEQAFAGARPLIRPGVMEREVAAALEAGLRRCGCRTLPFDIIVAAGRNSAMPHARPSDYRIRAGDLVVVDWGGEAGGYFSDMTRTLLIRGKGMARKIEIYETVLAANRKAIASVRQGIHVREVDGAAREVINRAGYADYFGHGTGHGVGLDVHEQPRISRLGTDTVRAGMIFTVEPGIYLPAIGGVRIEDMVVAGESGCKVLTSLPKELEVLNF